MTRREYAFAKRVADVIGEDLHTIHLRGFNLVDPEMNDLDLAGESMIVLRSGKKQYAVA